MTPQSLPRVVVLSKQHRLTTYLVEQLARDGVLAGVVYEERFRTFAETLRYLHRNAKREGYLHTLDVVLYEMYDRLFRNNEFRRGTEAILPLSSAPDQVQGNAPVYRVTDHNAPSTQALIAGLEPDLIVVHACGILKATTFGLARNAALNIHCGVLPEYRGHASTFWSLARRDTANVGVTVHHVARTVDTGYAVGIERIPFGAEDDDMTMWFRSFRAGVGIVRDMVRRVVAGEPLGGRPYDAPTGPHYPRRGFTQHVVFRWRTLPSLRKLAARRDSAHPRNTLSEE